MVATPRGLEDTVAHRVLFPAAAVISCSTVEASQTVVGLLWILPTFGEYSRFRPAAYCVWPCGVRGASSTVTTVGTSTSGSVIESRDPIWRPRVPDSICCRRTVGTMTFRMVIRSGSYSHGPSRCARCRAVEQTESRVQAPALFLSRVWHTRLSGLFRFSSQVMTTRNHQVHVSVGSDFF